MIVFETDFFIYLIKCLYYKELEEDYFYLQMGLRHVMGFNLLMKQVMFSGTIFIFSQSTGQQDRMPGPLYWILLLTGWPQKPGTRLGYPQISTGLLQSPP